MESEKKGKEKKETAVVRTVKKLPWGIFAGACGIVWSVLTVAIIAVNIVSDAMIASAGSDDGLGQAGWLKAILVVDIILTVLIAACIAMFVWKTVMLKKTISTDALQSDEGGKANESV
ncbi:MAG: hypothetical protein J1F39_02290 [Clostridiales bacterium]|nr:hypothetical protein [Clostridiales bacterium]